MPQIPHPLQRLTTWTGCPERINRQGVLKSIQSLRNRSLYRCAATGTMKSGDIGGGDKLKREHASAHSTPALEQNALTQIEVSTMSAAWPAQTL